MGNLIVIPARANSKGLPGKNTKLLGGKPLVLYSLEFAKSIQQPGDEICISTNDPEVSKVATDNGFKVHFQRPEELATDTAGSYEVLLHAVNFFESIGQNFQRLVLLQPTSPYRLLSDYSTMSEMYSDDIDMVVSVKKSKESPYFTLFEENPAGHLQKSKPSSFTTRQQCPDVFAYNGSIYLININSLKRSPLNEFTKVVKYVMPDSRSIDIDTPLDWVVAEYFFSEFIS